ncbi:MAG: hypothetical protein KIT36_24690 [Alphaproteobacteria bacterium]|nr:hypothetical protein [Alphaproteobacteria bacterium]
MTALVVGVRDGGALHVVDKMMFSRELSQQDISFHRYGKWQFGAAGRGYVT